MSPEVEKNIKIVMMPNLWLWGRYGGLAKWQPAEPPVTINIAPTATLVIQCNLDSYLGSEPLWIVPQAGTNSRLLLMLPSWMARLSQAQSLVCSKSKYWMLEENRDSFKPQWEEQQGSLLKNGGMYVVMKWNINTSSFASFLQISIDKVSLKVE